MLTVKCCLNCFMQAMEVAIISEKNYITLMAYVFSTMFATFIPQKSILLYKLCLIESIQITQILFNGPFSDFANYIFTLSLHIMSASMQLT